MGAGYAAFEVLYWRMNLYLATIRCAFCHRRAVRRVGSEISLRAAEFLTAAIAGPRMKAMAMAMAIAGASLMEQFFLSNTAKLFRLGRILALRWHVGPPRWHTSPR